MFDIIPMVAEGTFKLPVPERICTWDEAIKWKGDDPCKTVQELKWNGRKYLVLGESALEWEDVYIYETVEKEYYIRAMRRGIISEWKAIIKEDSLVIMSGSGNREWLVFRL
jgi:hypothetical protein